MHLQRVRKIQGNDLEKLHQWCEERRELLTPTQSGYARGRQELWLRRECDLGKNPTIIQGYRDEFIENLGEQILPGFYIGLLLLYAPDTCIKLHRDHTVFAPIAATINLGDAVFLMAETKQDFPDRYALEDGEVIQFNTKKLHGIEAVTSERWSIILWHLKPQYVT